MPAALHPNHVVATTMCSEPRGCHNHVVSDAGTRRALGPPEAVDTNLKGTFLASQAVEWGRHGITVNAVAPAFIRTPDTEPALSDPQFRAGVIERIAALHRIGEPAEVADVVVFLASPCFRR